MTEPNSDIELSNLTDNTHNTSAELASNIDSDIDTSANSNSNSNRTSNATAHPSIIQRLRNQVSYTINSAPLLRYINPTNRYNHLPSSAEGSNVIIGESNDGVFSNLSAKPTTNPTTNTDNLTLPTYEEASLDPTPPYWETSVMSDFDEIYIDGLPAGNILNFIWNMVVSITFQFIGFVITYLLHTSHAAKNGSQAGLGFTLIGFGFNCLPINIEKSTIKIEDNDKFEPSKPGDFDVVLSNGNGNLDGEVDDFESNLKTEHFSLDSLLDDDSYFKGTPLLAYFLFLVGGFIILKALYDFFKVKRLEYSIMHPATSTTNPEEAV